MRVAVLAAALLGTLPVLAELPELSDLIPKDQLGPCTPDLDGVKHCDPTGRTWHEFSCNAAKARWEPGDLCKSIPDHVTTSKRDWHIGCDPLGKCSYYEDDLHEHENLYRRHISAVQFAGLEASDTRKREYETPTRCNPDKHRHVQYFDPQSHDWINFHECDYDGACIYMDGEAACHSKDGSNILPHFAIEDVQVEDSDSDSEESSPPQTENKIAEQDTHGHIQTRCNPTDLQGHLVQFFGDEGWKNIYSCVRECENLQSFAACREPQENYIVPVPPTLISQRQSRRYFVSKRDPRESSNYNVYQKGEPPCLDKKLCSQGEGSVVNGLPNYDLREIRSANLVLNDVNKPGKVSDLKTKCNTLNGTEVLEWNGTSYSFHGVCPPPLVCENFGGTANVAVCVSQDPEKPNVWQPWPSLAASTHGARITRCENEKELFRFNGTGWIPYRKCSGVFTCHKADLNHENGGCVAKNLEQAKKDPRSVARHILITKDEEHYDPFELDSQPQLPKRGADKFVENWEDNSDEEHDLMNDGSNLIYEGANFRNQVFGAEGSDHFATDSDSGSSPTTASEASDSPSIQRTQGNRLLEDSHQKKMQGLRLIAEGERLRECGMSILQNIFDKDSELISSMVNRLSIHREKNTAAFSTTKPTAASRVPRYEDTDDEFDELHEAESDSKSDSD